VGARRFGPLILLVALGTLVIWARLFQVQVLEHATWESEAKGLVRQGAVVPYQRGEFHDRKGRLLVRNEQVYRVEFSYRDFRRDHPLGQVAHAWSSLEMRPVPLAEAWANLEPMAEELVQLTRADLAHFVDGEGLQGSLLRVPACDDPAAEFRASRRSDVRFYVSHLLGFDATQTLRASRAEDTSSLLEFAIRDRGASSADPVLDDLRRRLERSKRDLIEIAVQLERHDRDASESSITVDPDAALAHLLARLEGWREDVEDQTAGELFREAAGFPAARVDPATLLAHLDLSWLSVLLRWDEPRCEAWLRSSREAYLASLENWYLPRMTLEVELAPRGEDPAQVAFEGWRALFASDSGPGLVVFDQLDSLFRLRIPRPLRAAGLQVLPDPVGAEPVPAIGGFDQLAQLELWQPDAGGPDPREVAELAQAWREHLTGGVDEEWFGEQSLIALHSWEAGFQQALGEQLERLSALAGSARMPIAEGRLDRAEERARSVLKDRGSRTTEVASRPDYDLIQLVTRYPDHFAGFQVTDGTERLRAKDDRGIPIAESIVGNVRKPSLREVFAQRDLKRRLDRLIHRGNRDADQDESLKLLVRQVARLDEFTGGDGLEGYYDRELTGHNGYHEERGLQELADGTDTEDLIDLDPIPGENIELTLDVDLQRAAVDALAHPGEDPEPNRLDYDWLRRPCGAIVVTRVNGDVLAAASYPDFDRGGWESGDHRDMPIERTLRMPGFQPPGSVFKPFVAAWALDRRGLDTSHLVDCAPLPDREGSGYGGLLCHARWGHGPVALHEALQKSCNGYFAWLGEQLSQDDFRGLAAEFGFGRPTGVRRDRSRGGLHEDYFPELFAPPLGEREYVRAGNGLSVVQATPMQVARAYCGLATGVLPEMRLVSAVAGEPVAHHERPLALSVEALTFVRRALLDVTNSPGGSAWRALNEQGIGFTIAGKTGSADLTSTRTLAPDGTMRVRKHTWFAGYFPPEDPLFVVVVFVDDTIQTSSHSSVWVARKLLTSPEMRELIAEELPR